MHISPSSTVGPHATATRREMRDPRISKLLLDYPFADRLYPGALEALQRVRQWAPVVILSDGDAVFQSRKVDRSGL